MDDNRSPGKQLTEEHIRIFKFLIAGGYNTVFSFALFSGLYLWLNEVIHYIIIAVITHIVSIANSFLVHRYFVFQVPGNFLHQFLKSYIVYGVSIAVSLASLTLLVELFDLHPILAQALTIVVTVVISYIGNSRFTFREED